MKKFLRFCSVLSFVFLFVSCSFAYSGGTGSSSNPYIISSESDLLEFRDRVNNASDDSGSYYVISNDIQMTKYGTTWTPVGYSKPFTGHLEGNNRVVYVNIERTGSIKGAFFGTIASGASVTNLNIEGSVTTQTDAAAFALTLNGGIIKNCRFSGNIYISDYIPDEPTKNLNAAGLVITMNSGTIQDCIFNGEIKIDGGFYPRSGGIVSLMYGGNIKDCSVGRDSSVEAYASEVENIDTETGVTIRPSAISGGIVGQVNIGLNETIEGCEFHGKVTAESWNTSYAGGIVGYMRGGTLTNNVVRNDSIISGKYSAGGIVGFLRTGGTVDNNIAEAGSTVTAESHSAGGIIGILDLGTVTNNESHASITGNASFKGGVIGQVTPATETPATSLITGNRYSGSDYGIGSDASGSPSDDGTTHVASPFTITTSSNLDSGKIFKLYSQTFETNISSDRAIWSKTDGDFPSGLSLSGNTLSGTPTETGTFEFTLRASVYALYQSAEKIFSLTIESPLNITTSSDLESGIAGRTYGPITLETDAEDEAYITWSASDLPSGLSLGRLTGILSGTPTTSGYYTFTVTASSGLYTATKTFTIIINPSLQITTDSVLPSGQLNSEYSFELESDVSDSDSEAVTWQIIDGSLPSGLILSNDGIISGIPISSGRFSFTVQASIDGTDYTDSKEFFITIASSFSIITTSSDLNYAKINEYYFYDLETNAEDIDSVMWSITDGELPTGMTLSTYSGRIYGTPTATGYFTFTVRAVSGGLIAEKELGLMVRPSLSIITLSNLPDVIINQPYSYTLETDAESSDVVEWQMTDGTLPEGFTFEAGTITGISSSEGIYEFTIMAEVRTRRLSAQKNFVLAVRPPMLITNNDTYTMNAGSYFNLNLETDSAYSRNTKWTVIRGDIPLGLTLSEDGTISGTPSMAGTYTFTVQASSGYALARKDFTIRIDLVISSNSYLQNGTKGESYLEVLKVNGASFVEWSLVSGTLPNGLSLNSEGVISGIPTIEGVYDFMVNASANNSGTEISAQKTLRITIDSISTLPVPITTASLPSGQSGVSYYAELHSTISGVTWSLEDGRLPKGLNLTNGLISGIPSEAGTFKFTVKVSYGERESTRQFTLTIEPAEEPEPEPQSVSSSGGGCNSGLNLMMLFVSLGFIFRRKF